MRVAMVAGQPPRLSGRANDNAESVGACTHYSTALITRRDSIYTVINNNAVAHRRSWLLMLAGGAAPARRITIGEKYL